MLTKAESSESIRKSNRNETESGDRENNYEYLPIYNNNPITLVFFGQIIGILIFHTIKSNCFKVENTSSDIQPISGSKNYEIIEESSKIDANIDK